MHLVRRSPRLLWISLFILYVLVLIYPVRNGFTRVAMLLLPATLFGLALAILWRRRAIRYALLATVSILALFSLLPGFRPNPDSLQKSYVRSLRSYLGTRYVWGGENRIGIDCSGLVRAGMVDALFENAVTPPNPHALRASASLWWHDIAARDMPAGYAGRMHVLFSGTIRAVSDRQATLQLHPGDIAVTADGSHVIAYLGNDEWIEADPILLRVAQWRSTDRPENLDVPRTFLRWSCLDR